MLAFSLLILGVIICLTSVESWRIINYEEIGAVSDDGSDMNIMWANGALMNKTLNALVPGDVFLVPNKTFHLVRILSSLK